MTEPIPPVVRRIAEMLGYTEADLRRVHETTGRWPTAKQLENAADRRVASILNNRP